MATATTTAPRPRVSPFDRLTPPSGRRLGLGAAILVVEFVLAAALASGRLSITLLAFLGAVLLAIAFTFPMTTAVTMLVLGASVFYAELFEVSIGSLEATGAEVLLGALFIVALTRPRVNTWGGLPGAALGIFLALLGVATLLAVQAGSVDLLSSFAWGRVFLVFTFFYVVVRLFGDRESITRLLGWAAGIAAATGFLAVILSLFSGPAALFQDPSQQFIHTEEGLGIIARVRLPGLSLAYALFWYAAVRAIQTHGNQRWLWSVALGGMFLNIAVSFNRNMWVGLVVGTLLMLLLSGPLVRRRLVIALAMIAIGVGVLASQSGSDSRISPLVARGASLANTEDLEAERSIEDRQIESRIAIQVAKTNPIVGIGPGVDFGVAFFEATPGGVWVRVPQLFLHNQYLYLWLIAGLPALAAFLLYLLASLWSAWRWSLRTPEMAAWGVGIASIMLSAIVAIYFSSTDMIFGLALLTGAIFITAHDPGEQEEQG